ncbi:helix-turn-helix domain-containing protein [uncultured Alistipes sp.]|uniref:helix-turn-helix domain-containing protein n=1 Tax=uncultured Alistipes sp. TaxID=538949 RepID=UPI00260BE535|nr:helix-turn-helix domain-containing protein [uncultured Alistipes sp.]
MKGHLIDGKDVRVTDFFQRADKALKTLDELVKTTQYSFDGQRFLTDRELSQLLKISRRALQAYRTARIIPFYLISGKVIYKESEIQRMLEDVRQRSLHEQELV